MHVEPGGTWGSPPGWRSDRCAGCGGVLTQTRLSRQPKSDDHTAGCKQYILALQVMQLAAELAQATPEPEEGATALYGLSRQRYCREAAHDLKDAAQAKSVSDALKQQKNKYAADTHADDTDDRRGRAAAAKMLMLACQALSEGEKPASAASNFSANLLRQSGRAWLRRLPWGKRGPVR